MLSSVPVSSFMVFVIVVLVVYNVCVYVYFSRLVRGKGEGSPESVRSDFEEGETVFEDDVPSGYDFTEPSDGVSSGVPAPSPSEGTEDGVLTEDMMGDALSPSDEEIDNAFYELENNSPEPPEDAGCGEPDTIVSSELPGEADFSLIKDSLCVVPVDEGSLTPGEREALSLVDRIEEEGVDSFLPDGAVEMMEELRREELEGRVVGAE